MLSKELEDWDKEEKVDYLRSKGLGEREILLAFSRANLRPPRDVLLVEEETETRVENTSTARPMNSTNFRESEVNSAVKFLSNSMV